MFLDFARSSSALCAGGEAPVVSAAMFRRPPRVNPIRADQQTREILERAAGIEPASLAWKAKVLPLHNARALDGANLRLKARQDDEAKSSPQKSFSQHL